jgi:sporulation protein YlmC with PRC-barrel domain
VTKASLRELSNAKTVPLKLQEVTQMTTQTGSKSLRDTARDETATLIASDKVEGTAVYGADSEKIGRIENVMIDKLSGKVAYAVLSFGGWLGMGQDHYPLPWAKLKYNETLGGYVVNLTNEQLQSAPKYADDRWLSDVDGYWMPGL